MKYHYCENAAHAPKTDIDEAEAAEHININDVMMSPCPDSLPPLCRPSAESPIRDTHCQRRYLSPFKLGVIIAFRSTTCDRFSLR